MPQQPRFCIHTNIIDQYINRAVHQFVSAATTVLLITYEELSINYILQ